MNTITRMLREAGKSPNAFSSSKFSLLLDSCVRKISKKKTKEELIKEKWVDNRMEEILKDNTIKISCDPQRAYHWALSDWEERK